MLEPPAHTSRQRPQKLVPNCEQKIPTKEFRGGKIAEWGGRNGTCTEMGKEINVMIFALQRQTPKHSFHFTVPRPESVVSAQPSDSSVDIKMFINFFHPEITICLMAFVGLSLSLIHFFHLPKAVPGVFQCMFLRRHDWDLRRLLLLVFTLGLDPGFRAN